MVIRAPWQPCVRNIIIFSITTQQIISAAAVQRPPVLLEEGGSDSVGTSGTDQQGEGTPRLPLHSRDGRAFGMWSDWVLYGNVVNVLCLHGGYTLENAVKANQHPLYPLPFSLCMHHHHTPQSHTVTDTISRSRSFYENLPERYLKSATKLLNQMGKNAVTMVDTAKRMAERLQDGIWSRRRDG